jgi:hydroxymethylglutaryl-CoA lyase
MSQALDRDDIDVYLREVGLRDGLQNVSTFFPSDAKKEWIAAEAAAGVVDIEVCSFVPPKLIPQFQDALEIVSAAKEIAQKTPFNMSALMPNLKGAERGIAAGVDQLNYVTSVSETHNLKNVRRTPQESVDDFKAIVAYRDEQAEATGKRVKLLGGCATAFGCTLEGDIDPAAVVAIATQFVEAGADEISLADTVGYANPSQIKDLVNRVMDAIDVPITIHLHDTRGMGVVNAFAAYEAGIRRFDGCLGGLGGCPWAPGATGNVVMEDMAFMFESMGLRTGIDLDKLCAVREIVARELPDEPLSGGIAKAGAPKNFKPATPLAAAAE